MSSPPAWSRPDAAVVVVGAGATARWIALHLRWHAPDRPVTIVSPRGAALGGPALGRLGLRIGTVAPFPGPGAVGWVQRTGPSPSEDPGAAAEVVASYLARLHDLGVSPRPSGAALLVAADGAGLGHLGEVLRHARACGLESGRVGDHEAEASWLEADDLRRRIALERTAAAVAVRPAVVVDPGELDAALDAALHRCGVAIVEVDEVDGVSGVDASGLVTSHGTVPAAAVVWASPTAAALPPGWRVALRTSVLTEPLDELAWARLGWSGGEAIRLLPSGSDGRTPWGFARRVPSRWRRGVEAQRTASGAVLLAGDPVPAPRARDDVVPDAPERAVRRLLRVFRSRFPASAGVRFTDAWQTPVALPVGPRVSPVVVDEVGGVAVVGVAVGPFDLPLGDHLVGERVAAVLGSATDAPRGEWPVPGPT